MSVDFTMRCQTKKTPNKIYNLNTFSLLVCFDLETKLEKQFQEKQRFRCTLQKSCSETKQVNNEKVFESLLVVSLF